MKVADAMTPREELVTATVPGTREDVLDRLQDNEFSSIPVVKDGEDGEQFRGLVSREHLIEEPNEDQLALLAEEVESVSSTADLRDVAQVIGSAGQRRVPVVDDGSLVGIITITDVVRAIANGDVDADSDVEPLAKHAVNCVYRDTPLTVAERELAYADEAYGVVLDGEGAPEGMVTEVDILDVARIVEGEESTGDAIADEDDDWKWEGIKAVGSRYLPTRNVELPAEPVSSFMTEGLVTVSGSSGVVEAAQLMISEDIEQIPLVNGDELVGILRDTDLLEAL
ncbi:CBS domain-containing protein [Halorarius halobius]|uniref:CBS domain-containing protein n=1 Tax=Halorarius halobius TaxID=2962671 RepID=UPI0020CEF58F|nr:CBS domain-containing protein [Halorarius halobius]